MNDKELVKKSKFLSLVLRHQPEKIGLKLDENGWAITKDLCRLASITLTELDEVVEKNNKKRFEWCGHKDKIRACQGHSIEVDLELKPIEPPEKLYHGTSNSAYGCIAREGLTKQKRTYVHLSTDLNTAYKVGSRHGGETDRTVVLVVHALDMHNDGFKFYQSTNGVWLTIEVPVKYITMAV
jgi:putative RNA 2'-phosphotransferase